jgi:hypothetical protein
MDISRCSYRRSNSIHIMDFTVRLGVARSRLTAIFTVALVEEVLPLHMKQEGGGA